MNSPTSARHRRDFLKYAGLGGLFFTARGAFAQSLTLTPAQTLGPYYPDRMPLDVDNDLIVLNDNLTPAVGEVSWISGRVLGRTGTPVRGALVEIWQADNSGAYIHTASPIRNRDANFQGYGKFLTGASGQYLFRTVKPGLYPGRTRHVHYQVTFPTGEKLVTQLYVEGDALNNNDGVLNGIRDAAQRASVIRPWTKIPTSLAGELAVNFDIVLGYTPADPPAGKPVILSQGGVVNGAGYQPGVTAGAWLSLFGDNLSTTTRPWDSSEIVNGKLPTSLDGVSVQINGKPAAVAYISPSQVNVLAPNDDGSGQTTVTLTNANGTSAPVTVNLQQFLPGFFLFPQQYVAAVHLDGTPVGPAGLLAGATVIPARPGETISLYGTGFGPTTPGVASDSVLTSAAPAAYPVEVRMGSMTADVRFAGLSAAGLYQLNVVVPNLPDGDHDVVGRVGNMRTQSLARIRVQRT